MLYLLSHPASSVCFVALLDLPLYVFLPQMCHPVCGSGVGALLLLPDGSGNVLVSHSHLGRGVCVQRSPRMDIIA